MLYSSKSNIALFDDRTFENSFIHDLAFDYSIIILNPAAMKRLGICNIYFDKINFYRLISQKS